MNNVEGMWRHAKTSMGQYSRKKRFYAGYLAKRMFLKYCRNLNLNPLDEFFQLTTLLYDPIKPERDNIDVNEVVIDTLEPESEAEAENNVN